MKIHCHGIHYNCKILYNSDMHEMASKDKFSLASECLETVTNAVYINVSTLFAHWSLNSHHNIAWIKYFLTFHRLKFCHLLFAVFNVNPLSIPETKIVEFANNVDLDEMAQMSHLI